MNNKKKASSIVYIIFFFVFFLALCAFAIDATIIFTNREKVQNAAEIAALAGASAFETDDNAKAIKAATDTFKLLVPGGAKIPSYTDTKFFEVKTFIKTTPNGTERRVLVSVKALSQTFFLTFLGSSEVPLDANACAVRENLPIKSTYGSKVIWMSSAATYTSDILSTKYIADDQNNYKNTAMVLPLGNSLSGAKSASYSTATPTTPNLGLIDSSDKSPLSLGPGGYITIKLPAPIVDKPGNDLYVEEIGAAKEGYLVFAGIDNNPDNPYVDPTLPKGLISWVNISCSGNNDGLGDIVPKFPMADLINLTTKKDKVYGSAYFDLKNTCISTVVNGKSNLNLAKYLRIIDDNAEDAYYGNNYVNIYGEASTSTAGADIDSVKILDHVRLIPPTDFKL